MWRKPPPPKKKRGRRKTSRSTCPWCVQSARLPEAERRCECGSDSKPSPRRSPGSSSGWRPSWCTRSCARSTLPRCQETCRWRRRGVIEKGLLSTQASRSLIAERFGNTCPTTGWRRSTRRRASSSRARCSAVGARCAELLEPIAEQTEGARSMAADLIESDDTPVWSRKSSALGGRKGRMWTYLDPEGRHSTTSPNRGNGTARTVILGECRGSCRSDAYGATTSCSSLGKVVEVACWAHVRRNFKPRPIRCRRSPPRRSRRGSASSS